MSTKRSAGREGERPRAAPFVAVQVEGSPVAAMRAPLPIGVEVEFGDFDFAGCATLVEMLAAMFRLNPARAVYVHRDQVDFRKSVIGLVAIVAQSVRLDVLGLACFVFGNRRRDKVKLLGWEKNCSRWATSGLKLIASSGRTWIRRC